MVQTTEGMIRHATPQREIGLPGDLRLLRRAVVHAAVGCDEEAEEARPGTSGTDHSSVLSSVLALPIKRKVRASGLHQFTDIPPAALSMQPSRGLSVAESPLPTRYVCSTFSASQSHRGRPRTSASRLVRLCERVSASAVGWVRKRSAELVAEQSRQLGLDLQAPLDIQNTEYHGHPTPAVGEERLVGVLQVMNKATPSGSEGATPAGEKRNFGEADVQALGKLIQHCRASLSAAATHYNLQMLHVRSWPPPPKTLALETGRREAAVKPSGPTLTIRRRGIGMWSCSRACERRSSRRRRCWRRRAA